MQSADFDEDLYKKWFRRPTLFVACAWFLLALAGRIVIRLALGELALLLRQAGLADVRGHVAAAGDIIYQMGVLAFPVLWYAARHAGVEQAMRLHPPHPLLAGHAILLAAAAVPLSGCLSGWWMLMIRQAGGTLSSAAAAPDSPAALTRALLLSALLPACCEEIMFRGGIMGAWGRRGSERALVASALMFTALHGSVQGLPAQLVMGFVLGYAVLRTGSLWTGVIIHGVFNAGVLALQYLLGGHAEANIYAIASSRDTLRLFAADTVATAALFCLLLVWLKKLCDRLQPEALSPAPADLSPFEPLELVVLFAGVITAAVVYMEDILSICGVL